MNDQEVSTDRPISPDKRLVLLPPSYRQATEWLAVLQAAGIFPEVRRGRLRWQLLVDPVDADRARRELREYLQETRHWPPVWSLPGGELLTPSVASIVVAFLLIAFFVVTGPSIADSDWFVTGSADAAQVVGGQWYRAITALTLHGDLGHVLSNAVAIAFLGSMVCRRAGEGGGWLLMLLGGTAGNLVNAWLYRVDHDSVGASTLVFAAVGLLAALHIAEHRLRGGPWNWRGLWVPLLVVFVMYGLMGLAPGTDITAHFFGAIAGLVVGLASPLALWWRDKPLVQGTAGFAAVGLIFASWYAALA